MDIIDIWGLIGVVCKMDGIRENVQRVCMHVIHLAAVGCDDSSIQ
jgi:hypothetical protein